MCSILCDTDVSLSSPASSLVLEHLTRITFCIGSCHHVFDFADVAATQVQYSTVVLERSIQNTHFKANKLMPIVSTDWFPQKYIVST